MDKEDHQPTASSQQIPSAACRTKSDQTSDIDRCSFDSGLLNETPPEEFALILRKMEQLNSANESDTRSVISKRSDGSSSGSQSAVGQNNLARQSTSQQEDDETVDLWTNSLMKERNEMRTLVWSNLIKSWEVEMNKRGNCVRAMVRRGVPQHFRTIVWQLLAGTSGVAVHEKYTEFLRQNSPYEKVILRDVGRTFPELEFFKDEGKGQKQLFNVLKAYSVYDPQVGYCQGSAFIVGLLLLQMTEEDAFAVFVKLMENYRLRELYKPSMTELGLCMFQLECLVQEQMPDLYQHFNNMGFDTSMYATNWFLVLFTTTLSLDLANRVMDVFLVDGMESIFRIAMAILQQSRFTLLQLDMEGMLKYFQREIREKFDVDHDLLFMQASQVVLNAKKMKKLEKDYMAKRTKEQEEAIELRRLRTENRLLRQRIDYLEHESSALADRLVKSQIDTAMTTDNCHTISHELQVLREINTDAHKRLEEAYETIRDLSSNPKPGESNYIDTGVQVDDESMIQHIHNLQQELIEAHSKKADLENSLRELKLRVNELESSNKRLLESPPQDSIASIQEELIRVKMREAEGSLSLKEMRQRLQELEQHWQKYEQSRLAVSATLTSPQSLPNNIGEGEAPATDTSSVPQTARKTLAKLTASIMGTASAQDSELPTIRELEDQLMCLRIREADASVELREMRQKVMELETQNHVCFNQLKRQDDEVKRLIEEKEILAKTEREVSNLLKEEQHKLLAAESEMKEKNVMQRLKYTEALQNIADLKQYIAKLESKSAEKLAHAQLRESSLMDLEDLETVSSNRSGGSAADATSINSEEMSAFLADVTMKNHGNLVLNGDSLLEETDEEDNNSTMESNGKHKTKTKRSDKEAKVDEDSGLESNGIHLSDN